MQNIKRIAINQMKFDSIICRFSTQDSLEFEVFFKDAVYTIKNIVKTADIIRFDISDTRESKLYYKGKDPLLCDFIAKSTILVAASIWRQLQQKFPEHLFAKYMTGQAVFTKSGDGIKLKNQFVTRAVISAFSAENNKAHVVGINKQIGKTLKARIRNESKEYASIQEHY